MSYDDEEVRATGDERVRKGRSFQTRNIGIMVALKSIGDDSRGILIATTHLFWHPKYVASLSPGYVLKKPDMLTKGPGGHIKVLCLCNAFNTLLKASWDPSPRDCEISN